jgi:hypothetical protein
MYGSFERALGRLLDPFPRVRGVAKSAYQRLNYYVYGRRGPKARLHPQVALENTAAIGGRPEEDSCATFFGYFGLCPWDRSARYMLLHRLPRANSPVVEICLRDSVLGTLRPIAETSAWNFQQGSMAQWAIVDGTDRVCFNDLVEGRLVCRTLFREGEEHRSALPLQALHPKAHEALAINYRRLWRLRPEYGYDTPCENLSPDQPLREDGIWRMQFPQGSAQLIVTLEDLASRLPAAQREGAQHKVNHALYSPSGSRFVFMHRWLGAQGKRSRLYCADADTGDLRLLLDHGMVSHYAWRDEHVLLVWARTLEEGDRYYLLDVDTGARSVLGRDVLDRHGDGHPAFAPGGRWLVTDTYPDRSRMRHLLLHDLQDGRVIEVASLFSPLRFDGIVRCDLHPRWSPDGTAISVDSAHEGARRSYVVDVRALVEH